MRVVKWLMAAALLALAPGTGAAEPAQDFVGLFKASSAAYEARDYARMEQLLRQALKLRPAHPRAQYNLAAALALGGRKNDALDLLRGLARMGLSFDAAADADFAGLRDWDGFKDVSRAFARNRKPAGEAAVTFSVPGAPAFIPEGLAFDPDDDHFYLGSVRERRILRIDEDGQASDFTPAGASWAVLGLAVDDGRRLLWAATAALPEMKDAKADELGRSALVAYDLKTGAERQRHELPQDGARHALGDLVVARDGKVYATDSAAGLLYVLDPATGKLEALTAPGALAAPQGLAFGRDRNLLYVADYTQGLYRFDLRKRALTRLDVADDISVYGIDGLYRFEDDLIAVQNGIRPHRVVRLALDRNGKRVRHATVLAAGLSQFDEPTLGAVVDRRFHFVANSQWGRFGKDHALPADAALRGPVVLSVSLERRGGQRPGERQRAPAQPPPASPLDLPPVGLPPIR
jgi:sugar lactone lactonase YvrE